LSLGNHGRTAHDAQGSFEKVGTGASPFELRRPQGLAAFIKSGFILEDLAEKRNGIVQILPLQGQQSLVVLITPIPSHFVEIFFGHGTRLTRASQKSIAKKTTLELAELAPIVLFIDVMVDPRRSLECSLDPRAALQSAVEAAHAAGRVMRRYFRSPKKINDTMAHDLKLELDVRCQRLITRILRTTFPEISLLGEEGTTGDTEAAHRWIVDPIDGTVNYAYQIPHACVSIALQQRPDPGSRRSAGTLAVDRILLGVIYDPFCDETWTAIQGQTARLNGQVIRVSDRKHLAEAVVSIGFAKHDAHLQAMIPGFQHLVPRVRKIRIMGSAALDLAYVASGRMDGYVEAGLRLWDIAAGGLIVECAGGDFRCEALPGEHYYRIVASNGKLRKALLRLCGTWTTGKTRPRAPIQCAGA
jgi:myo-inositol-1(or 4)-monophosphatase